MALMVVDGLSLEDKNIVVWNLGSFMNQAFYGPCLLCE